MNRRNKWLEWWRNGVQLSEDSGLLRGLFVSAVCVIGTVSFLPVKYDVNDDFGVVMALSGGDGFPAGQTGWFISRILSQTLYFSYRVAAGVPWYGLILYCCAWLASGFAVSNFWYGVADRRLRLLVLPAWTIALGHCLVAVTFTSVTLWLELGVFLYLLRWLHLGRPFRIQCWILSGAWMLSYLWRAPLALYFTVFALPLFLYTKRADRWSLVRWIVPCLLLVVVDQVSSSWDRRTEAAQRFVVYSRLRAQFHDRPSGREGPLTETAIREADWLPEDHELYRSRWFLYDEDRFSPQRIARFLTKNQPPFALNLTQVRSGLNYVWQANRNYLPLIGCVLLAMILHEWPQLWGAFCRRWLRTAIVLGLPLSLMLFLTWYRMPSRISLPLMLYFLGTLLVLSQEVVLSQDSLQFPEKLVGKFRFWHACVTWGLFGVACFLGLQAVRADRSSLFTERAQLQFVQTSIRALAESSVNSPLVIRLDPRHAFGFDAVHPLREREGLTSMRLLPAGSWIRSPRYYRILHELKASTGAELIRQAVDRPDILFVLHIPPGKPARDQAQRTLRLWELYVDRHLLKVKDHSQKVAFEVLRTFGQDDSAMGQLIFYRLRSVQQVEGKRVSRVD
ncbi:MAG: hypothetical protein CMJ75_16705 [Planctomycetaceae bacterium]|nr:hypothetical protein [Planctomycetaceae bacterium]